MNDDAGLILRDNTLVDAFGQPLAPAAPEVIGIDLYEAPGGADAITAYAAIADLRKRREKSATLVLAPGEISVGLLAEVAVFNAEVYQNRELSESEKSTVSAAVAKRERRKARNIRNQARAEKQQQPEFTELDRHNLQRLLGD